MSQCVAAEISGPQYFKADSCLADIGGDVDAEPALCAVVTVEEEDELGVKSVRFGMDDGIDKPSSRPGKHGNKFIPGPAHSRQCVAARVAARQRAIDLAGVVDGFDEISAALEDRCEHTE